MKAEHKMSVPFPSHPKSKKIMETYADVHVFHYFVRVCQSFWLFSKNIQDFWEREVYIKHVIYYNLIMRKEEESMRVRGDMADCGGQGDNWRETEGEREGGKERERGREGETVIT